MKTIYLKTGIKINMEPIEIKYPKYNIDEQEEIINKFLNNIEPEPEPEMRLININLIEMLK